MRKGKRARRTRSPKLSIREALAIVRALAREPMTAEDLVRAARTSRATLFRVLSDLQHELRVSIEWDESTSAYHLTDWGFSIAGE